MRHRLTILTTIVAALILAASAAFAAPQGDTSSVKGGGNWPWSYGNDSGTNYLQVTARDDRNGDSRGVIHWRQTRNGDPNYRNLVADVTCHYVDEDTAYLSGVTADGTSVYATVVDDGEPGVDDRASVTTTGDPNEPCGDNPNVAPRPIENGNFQVVGNDAPNGGGSSL